jgi:hypothetical protein
MLGRGNQLREGKNEPRVKSWKEKLKWLRLSNQMLMSTSPIRVRLMVLKTVRQYYIYSDGYRFLCRATGRRSWLPFVWLLTLLPYDADSRPGNGSAGWYELHEATRKPNTVGLHPPNFARRQIHCSYSSILSALCKFVPSGRIRGRRHVCTCHSRRAAHPGCGQVR